MIGRWLKDGNEMIVRVWWVIICKSWGKDTGRRGWREREGQPMAMLVEFVVSHPFAKCANGWGTELLQDQAIGELVV